MGSELFFNNTPYKNYVAVLQYSDAIPWYFDVEYHDITMVHIQKYGNYLNNSAKGILNVHYAVQCVTYSLVL